MASYVSQYRGIGQMQPSGYTELLASGGQSIAAGISSFGNSIGDAIKRYQEKKELAGIAEGDLIAKWKADPTIRDRMPDEQKKLAEKVLSGNGSYKDIMSLHAYVDTSYKLEQQRKQDEILGIQKSLLEYQRDNALRAKQTQETLDGALGAALGASGQTVEVPTQRMASPTYLGEYMNAVESGTATPEQRAEVERYYRFTQPDPQTQQPQGPPSLFDSQIAEESARRKAAADAFVLKNYEAQKSEIESQMSELQKPSGVRFPNAPSSQYAGWGNIDAYTRGVTESPEVRRAKFNEAKVRLAKLEASRSEALSRANPAASPQSAPVAPQAPKGVSFDVREDAQMEGAPQKVSLPATPEDKFGAALKWISESGHKINSDVITELKDKLNLADVSVKNVSGVTVVMSGGKPIEVFQQKGIGEDLKPLTAEESKRLEAIQSADKDLEDLVLLVDKMSTGPISGRLQSMNPYAVDASALDAKANATVPNLARGVFGEVGVLTDRDVDRFKALLPNIRDTHAQRVKKVELLRNKLKHSRGNTIASLANSGRDVSGWLNSVSAEDVINATSPQQSSGGVIRYSTSGKRID